MGPLSLVFPALNKMVFSKESLVKDCYVGDEFDYLGLFFQSFLREVPFLKMSSSFIQIEFKQIRRWTNAWADSLANQGVGKSSPLVFLLCNFACLFGIMLLYHHRPFCKLLLSCSPPSEILCYQ